MTDARPKILALYPRLPSMAKAAGEKTAFKFVETLHGLGHRIVLLSFAFNGYDEKDFRALEPLCEKIVLHPFGFGEKLANVLRGWHLSPTLAARRSPGFGQLIDEHIGGCDLVHMEFTELLPWACYVKRKYPQKRVCYVAHDIVFQKKYREARSCLFVNLWRDLDLIMTWRSENRFLGCADRVIVLNRKDAALIPRHRARVRVVVPYAQPVAAGASVSAPPASGRYLVYYGAMDRPENYLAAISFIRNCWPQLRREFPQLGFCVVGARPHDRLREFDGRDGVTVTGFVNDPAAYLAGAFLTVAPITLGAGIKVKVLESLLNGSPVVAFPAGAEGIDVGPEEGLTVVAGYREMTAEIRRVLNGAPADRGAICSAARRAFDWGIAENFLREDYR
ncbi:glycosyl transferase family 1 [Geotalea uraniireducens]|uniref:Glycosyl transferase family 1 n=1 Tax=Geotalea uraniireducens TaxID=351604 RepID=A0ABM8EH63_9BACT|nr:glycosyltransferase [Geotalea uraniireducens]BDV41762.1 glycosyl transferase family 1 [Geotalea uraniireducens]